MKKAKIATRHGDIVIEFLSDKAPNHVENFIELAEKGFYENCLFHRVIPGFMIQGGDPNSKLKDRQLHGTGGSGKNIKAEFSDVSHVRGIVSMARAANPNSASSQFFIMTSDSSHLNGQYSAFGKVIEGLDAVDAIVAEDKDFRDNPVNPVEMSVTIFED